jgi:hypothetical protein
MVFMIRKRFYGCIGLPSSSSSYVLPYSFCWQLVGERTNRSFYENYWWLFRFVMFIHPVQPVYGTICTATNILRTTFEPGSNHLRTWFEPPSDLVRTTLVWYTVVVMNCPCIATMPPTTVLPCAMLLRTLFERLLSVISLLLLAVDDDRT